MIRLADIQDRHRRFPSRSRHGKYYFVLDNDAQTVQELNAGETISRYLEFTVSDGKGGVLNTWVTANIKGTNDQPELTVNQPDLGVAEDGTLTASGTVSTTDSVYFCQRIAIKVTVRHELKTMGNTGRRIFSVVRNKQQLRFTFANQHINKTADKLAIERIKPL